MVTLWKVWNLRWGIDTNSVVLQEGVLCQAEYHWLPASSGWSSHFHSNFSRLSGWYSLIYRNVHVITKSNALEISLISHLHKSTSSCRTTTPPPPRPSFEGKIEKRGKWRLEPVSGSPQYCFSIFCSYWYRVYWPPYNRRFSAKVMKVAVKWLIWRLAHTRGLVPAANPLKSLHEETGNRTLFLEHFAQKCLEEQVPKF